MTRALRLSALALLASSLGCQAIAGIDRKHPTVEVDLELCRDYCETVTRKCTGDYQVYHDEDQCMSACRQLPAHPVKDSNNSVECRYQVASSISSEQTDCAGAGPGGGGSGGDDVCGTNCENYCWLMSQACNATSDFRAYWLGDLDKCNAACKGLRDRSEDEDNTGSTSLYSAASDEARDHFGDTLQCRLFHAVAATAPRGDIGHCWHAALSPHARPDLGSTNPCLADPGQTEPRCSDYCRLVTVACTDDLKVYADEKQCLAGCSTAFPIGNVKDDRPPEMATHKNTLGCRYTHAYNALVSAPANLKMHCGHASPSGDGTCGSTCEAYCYQLFATCPNEAKDKRDVTQCESECNATLDPASVMPYSLKLAKSGKSQLACRVAALTEARASASKTDKCEIAAGKRPCM